MAEEWAIEQAFGAHSTSTVASSSAATSTAASIDTVSTPHPPYSPPTFTLI